MGIEICFAAKLLNPKGSDVEKRVYILQRFPDPLVEL